MPKMAQKISIFLCEHCAAVHIGMWRDGKMFAEAIPADIATLSLELQAAIVESNQRRGKSTDTHKH